MKKLITLGICLSAASRSRWRLPAAPPLRSGSASAARSPAAAPPSARRSSKASSRRSPTSTRPAASSGRRSSPRSATTAADPKEGVSVANKFAADGVKFVIGHFNSGVTMPASEVYQENGILEITPASTNPKVTERNMWNIFRTLRPRRSAGRLAGDYHRREFQGQEHRLRPRQDHLRPGPRRRDAQGDQRQGHEGRALRGRQQGRQGLHRAGLEDQVGRPGSGLLGRPARYRRPDRAPDARAGRQGAADGRRRHHRRRVRRHRRARRRGHADDLLARPAHQSEEQGDRRAVPQPRGFEPQAYTLYSYAAVQIIKQAAEQAKSLDPRRSPR